MIVAELCGAIRDWDALVNNAQQHFIAGLVFNHLKTPAGERIPVEALKKLKKYSLMQAGQYLRITAAQRDLSENILRRFDIAHIFVKGSALAAEYYIQPAMRPARDVDVLIPRSEILRFWEIAQSLGYRRLPKPDSSEQIPVKEAVWFFPVIDLVAPTGTIIEVHSALDKSEKIFDTNAVIDRANSLATDAGEISVADIHDHFLFVCLHHSRHLFSHLHWLTDLDAIMTHHRFSLDEALSRAKETNILSTVEACIDLRNACAITPVSLDSCKTRGGRELMSWCLKSLREGVNAERATRQSRKSPDFALDWQFGIKHRLQILGGRLKPTFADYQQFPLPRRWWWIYYLIRPLRLTKELLRATWANLKKLKG